MSTHLQNRLEKIQELMSHLATEANQGKSIVVEGKKDAQALAELGIVGKVVLVKSGGKSFLQVTQEIEESGASEIILLLDFDRRGVEGTHRLRNSLERARIGVNCKFWLDLRGLVSRDVQCIESLPSFMRTLEEKAALQRN